MQWMATVLIWLIFNSAMKINTLVSGEKSGVDTDHIGSWDNWFKPELLQAHQNVLSPR